MESSKQTRLSGQVEPCLGVDPERVRYGELVVLDGMWACRDLFFEALGKSPIISPNPESEAMFFLPREILRE